MVAKNQNPDDSELDPVKDVIGKAPQVHSPAVAGREWELLRAFKNLVDTLDQLLIKSICKCVALFGFVEGDHALQVNRDTSVETGLIDHRPTARLNSSMVRQAEGLASISALRRIASASPSSSSIQTAGRDCKMYEASRALAPSGKVMICSSRWVNVSMSFDYQGKGRDASSRFATRAWRIS